MSVRCRWVKNVWGVSLVSCCSLLTSAQSFGQSGTFGQSGNLARSRQTNGAAIRHAFDEVVGHANLWTVRIVCGKEQVVLGIVVGADGQILTKASQLSGDISCCLADGRQLPARYIGQHEEQDLALLKVEAENLPTVEWQDEGDPDVGRWVVSPDQEDAQAVGVVSVERRSIAKVQTRGVLGIKLSEQEDSPASIAQVFTGSAAETARLLPGDVIHKVNDISVRTRFALVNEIGKYRPGDRLVLEVERDGRQMTIAATLSHPFGDFLSRIAMQNQMGGELSDRRTGFPQVLQHDSVLKPEECGGPLVDLSGKAVGINIARAGRTESYAIPDDVVRGLLGDLIAGRYPPPASAVPVSVVARKLSSGDEPADASATPATPSEM